MRHLATIQGQKPATVRRKEDIARLLLKDFPGGADCQISRIRLSANEAWIAAYRFGYASQNLYVQFIKSLFIKAVDDRLQVESPVARLQGRKVVKPIRITPSCEEFRRILEDVRAQEFNAFTETLKQGSLAELPKRTEALCGLLDMAVGLN